jgi:hypothetical protein
LDDIIDFANCNLDQVSVHNVGNKTNGEDLFLSRSLLDISDIKVRELLFNFFLNPFTNPEFYSFSFTNDDFRLNPIFIYASQVFESIKTFHENSVNLAKHLYELSVHPQIKSGDLFIAYFTDLRIVDEITDAIGIFKSENKQKFLKLNIDQSDFIIQSDDGINIEKLDKGCLIFNTYKESGYKVCIIDKSSKSIEAQYWKDNFLQIKPCSDHFHNTKDLMTATKNFVIKHLPEEHDVNKADQIEILNRSVEYFKSHDNYEKEDYENSVFQEKSLIKSFNEYNESYRDANNIDYNDNFKISQLAVKTVENIEKRLEAGQKFSHLYSWEYRHD